MLNQLFSIGIKYSNQFAILAAGLLIALAVYFRPEPPPPPLIAPEMLSSSATSPITPAPQVTLTSLFHQSKEQLISSILTQTFGNADTIDITDNLKVAKSDFKITDLRLSDSRRTLRFYAEYTAPGAIAPVDYTVDLARDEFGLWTGALIGKPIVLTEP